MNKVVADCTVSDTEVVATQGVNLAAMACASYSDAAGINAIVQTRNKEIQLRGFLRSNVPCDVGVGLIMNTVVDESNAAISDNISVTPEGVHFVIEGVNNAPQNIVEYGILMIFSTSGDVKVTIEYSNFNVYI